MNDASLELTIDPEKLRAALGESLGSLETAPVDATFEVTAAGTVNVVPSQNGRQVDMDQVADALLDDEAHITAGLKETPPARDTAWAESMHIKEQVSTFTTNHKSGEERVKNIHRAADILNNTVVEPGRDVLAERHDRSAYRGARALSSRRCSTASSPKTSAAA